MDASSLPAAGADAGGENQGQSAQVPAASGQDTVVTVIHDDEETGERGKDQAQHKRIMPMKRPNLDVRAEFDLETKGEGKTGKVRLVQFAMRLEQYVAGVEQKRNAGALGHSAYGGLAFRPILWEAGEGLSPKI